MRARHGPWLALLGVLAVIGLLWLAGCGSQPTLGPTSFTSLRVLRTSAFPQNHIPPFERTTTDAASVRQFYATLLALPTPPPGPSFCPVDFGVQYHLTFYAGTQPAAFATVNAGGCGGVTIGTSSRWWARSDSFWQQFASTLGVPKSALYPVLPQPAGPAAPTAAP